MISSRIELDQRLPKADKLKVSRDKRLCRMKPVSLSNPLFSRPLMVKKPLLPQPPRPTNFSVSEVEMMPNSLAEEEAAKVEEVLQRPAEEERVLSKH